jgi:dihydroorotate dehydrogenase
MKLHPALPLMRLLPAETAHHLAILGMSVLGDLYKKNIHLQTSPLKVGPTYWNNPFGLAAGFDKNAQAWKFLSQIGFGSLELGTVTLHSQSGNPKPRLFRYEDELSLRNSMGFPNWGKEKISPLLPPLTHPTPCGLNIGPNKNLTPDQAIRDLMELVKSFKDKTHWITLNISSPNTPGLRSLDEKWLETFFAEVQKEMSLTKMFLKISPDIENKDIYLYHKLASTHSLAGLIATNTTMMSERGTGGVSGQLLKKKSQTVWMKLLNLKPNYEVIAVGGFSQFQDWLTLWAHGGKCAQFYTSFIYQGPAMLEELILAYDRFFDFVQMDVNDFFARTLKERQECLKAFLHF